MKATVQCFPIALFIMLYKVIQIFQSVNEIWRCDHSNETSPGLCTHRTICLVRSSKFRVCRGNPYRLCDQSNKETKINFENLVLGQQVFQNPQLQSILIFSTFVHPYFLLYSLCYLHFFLVFSAVTFKFHSIW